MAKKRRFIDLHTHTTASDGALAPAEVVRLADAEGLAAVAITDHDTTAGLAEAREAAAPFPQLSMIPGVEVSATFSPGTLHVLGLGIDEAAPALQRVTAFFRAAREQRNPAMIARLQALGMAIDMDDVLAAARHGADAGPKVVSRLHIAQALVAKRLAGSIQEAFERYVGSGGAAYVPRKRLPPDEVIAAIHEAGGAAVAAHPVQMKCETRDDLERVIRSLKDVGLDGIEVYHSDHDDEQTRFYLNLACELGLLVTGGSDFHGPAKPAARIGHPRTPAAAVGEPWASRWFGRRANQ